MEVHRDFTDRFSFRESKLQLRVSDSARRSARNATAHAVCGAGFAEHDVGLPGSTSRLAGLTQFIDAASSMETVPTQMPPLRSGVIDLIPKVEISRELIRTHEPTRAFPPRKEKYFAAVQILHRGQPPGRTVVYAKETNRIARIESARIAARPTSRFLLSAVESSNRLELFRLGHIFEV
jgi:hypothetical protein